MKNKETLFNTFKKNFQVLKMVFRFCPALIYCAIIYIIACVLTSLLRVYFIDIAAKVILSGATFNEFLTSILYILSLEVFFLFIKIIYEEFVQPRYRNIYIKRIQSYLFNKVKEIDMEEYDNPVFYNKFSRALRDSQWRGFRVYNTFMDFIKSICITIALGTYIIISDIFLIGVILLSAIISLFALNNLHKLWYKLWKETENEHRFKWYINRTFYNVKYAAEMKTTNVSSLLIEKFEDSVNLLEIKTIKNNKRHLPFETLFQFSNYLIANAGILIYLGYKLLKGLIDIASFSSTVNAVNSFYSQFMNGATAITTLKEHARYIDDFLWVVDYKPELEKNEGQIPSILNSIKIKSLNFKYNQSNNFVINNLDFEINRGEKIAIVGHNGSGKTTLIKLILKLYNQSSGNILYNDEPYENINPFLLRKQMAVVFQDYQIYALSIAENILLRKLKTDEDYEKVYNALKSVGLYEKVMGLKDGINTQMTKEFDATGEAFSGGERQRLVCARVFASDASLYILDEPTASLDPLAEEKINKLILKANPNITIIIIAHRLSTVVDCDKIYLMKQGTFTEIGTHEELMALNKDYAEMFNTQKHLYEKH